MGTFSADGRWLVNGDGRSWRVGKGEEGPRHPGGVVAFAPAAQRLCAWCERKGVVILTEVETAKEGARLEDPNQDGDEGMTFTAGGSRLIGVASDSSCVRVWDFVRFARGLRTWGSTGTPRRTPTRSPNTPGGRRRWRWSGARS